MNRTPSRIYYAAQCKTCDWEPQFFSSYEERKKWIADHREETGHVSHYWLEAA